MIDCTLKWPIIIQKKDEPVIKVGQGQHNL